MSTDYGITDADNKGYGVVSLGEGESDRIKITLINRSWGRRLLGKTDA